MTTLHENTEDTGERRRLTDKVSTDDALELICALAYAKAVADPEVCLEQVERAIMKLRELKLEVTGQFAVLQIPPNCS